jgi:hypothetical protein
VAFTQLGRHLHCKPGQFLLEYGDEPYEVRYGASNALWVLKVPEAALQARLDHASRYCARAEAYIRSHLVDCSLSPQRFCAPTRSELKPA